MAAYTALIRLRQPELQGVFRFMDGLKLAMFKPLQNAYYNRVVWEIDKTMDCILFFC